MPFMVLMEHMRTKTPRGENLIPRSNHDNYIDVGWFGGFILGGGPHMQWFCQTQIQSFLQ